MNHEDNTIRWIEPTPEDIEAAKPLAFAIQLILDAYKERFGSYPQKIEIEVK